MKRNTAKTINKATAACADEKTACRTDGRGGNGHVAETDFSIQPESHPLEPFLPADARLLMLGSFPPKRNRWSMDFYYPNLQNDMWRIMGIVFYGNRDHFLMADRKRFDETAIRTFCQKQGIALSDTAREIIRLRDNAADQYLRVVRPIDLEDILLRLPACRAVLTTGEKATETLLGIIGCTAPKVGGCSAFEYGKRQMTLYRMPSSSRAYPLPLERKAAYYEAMFRQLGML